MSTADLLAVSVGINAALIFVAFISIGIAAYMAAKARTSDTDAVHELRREISEQGEAIERLGNAMQEALSEIRRLKGD